MDGNFRKLRRIQRQLSEDGCRELLRHEKRGVLAVNGEGGYPYAFPMDFFYHEATNSLYFHSGKRGYKLDALRASDRVCFCILDEGQKVEGKNYPKFQSVILFGRIRFVEDPEQALRYARAFGEKFKPAEEVEEDIQRSGAAVQMLELEIDHMSGKWVIEE